MFLPSTKHSVRGQGDETAQALRTNREALPLMLQKATHRVSDESDAFVA
ncbi:MAG: hypothetical protein HC933_07535 [Pleurocapsa sp. SU_196_0]|nr:hypothetical protein [Pleurocapsa sp. SU_196_0]